MEINLKEVKESFITTTHDLLQRSEALLLEMERQVNPEHYTELLRAVHTIKGNAGIFELDSVIHLCHAFETFLEELRTAAVPLSTELIDTGLTVIDRIRSLVALVDDPQKMAAVQVQDVIAAMENRGKTGVAAKPVQTGNAPEKSEFDRLRAHTQKLRLPEKYLELARRNNHYLIFVVIDLGDQGNLSLSQLHAKFKALHKSGNLLSLGVLRKETITDNPAGPFMPYFLILHSEGRAEAVIEKLGLKILLFHYFWQPEHKPEAAAEPVHDGGRSADAQAKETHLKVHLDLLNSLIDITGEIVLTRNALVRRIEQSQDQGLAAFTKKLSYLVTDLQDKVMKTRLQALGTLFQRFPRLVRETAAATGKKANLHTVGGEIELDKAIIDEIADPLVHIIRNAVDHGLELPEVRAKNGKDEAGAVTLSAAMREGNIVISVEDDGGGLDYEQIRAIAVRKGLVSREAATEASEQEVSEYLFLPGFSTKAEITTISGRGVGMDVVRSNIKKLGGSVEIIGAPGKGSKVILNIPQTLSILTCLVVETGGARFVIPQQNILEVVTIEKEKLKTIQNKEAYELRSKLLPLVDTAALIDLKNENSSASLFVVLRTEKYHYGLTFERVLDTEEVVVKALPQFGQEQQVFSGAAIMGDGKIALILDAAGIGRHANLQATTTDRTIAQNRQLTELIEEQHLLFRFHNVLVAFKVVEIPRIESIDPKTVETIVDRQVVHYRNEVIPIIPLSFLGAAVEADKPEGSLIILQSAGRKYGLLASEIIDLLNQKIELRHDDNDRAEIDGFTIVDDQTVVVLNLARLMHMQMNQAGERKLLEAAP